MTSPIPSGRNRRPAQPWRHAVNAPHQQHNQGRHPHRRRLADRSAGQGGEQRPRRARYTAPSLVFTTADGRRLEAGGFQPVEAYDVIIANLDPTLHREPAPEEPAALLEYFPSASPPPRWRP